MIARSRLAVLVVGVAIIAEAACREDARSSAPPSITTSPTASPQPPTPSPSPACQTSGTQLEITAQKVSSSTAPSPYSFDKECLAAPADTQFTIRFDNRDTESHNIDVLDHPGGTSLFRGKIIKGPKVVMYAVKPLSSGTYYFRCDIHPLRMNGTLLVGQ